MKKQNKQCTSKSNSDCDKITGSFCYFWPCSQSLVSKTRTLHEAMGPSAGEYKNMHMFGEFCCFLIIISFNYPESARMFCQKIYRGFKEDCKVLKTIIRPQNINSVYWTKCYILVPLSPSHCVSPTGGDKDKHFQSAPETQLHWMCLWKVTLTGQQVTHQHNYHHHLGHTEDDSGKVAPPSGGKTFALPLPLVQ